MASNNMESTSFPLATESPLESLSVPEWYKGLIIATVPTVVSGTIGNALVLASYLKFPELRSPTNMLIANQGLADLLTCVCSGFYTYFNYTVSGRLLTSAYKYVCLVILCSLMMSVYSSLVNLLLLSVDRLFSIQFPFTYLRIVDESLMKKVIAILWFALIVLTSIPLFGVNTWQPEQICGFALVLPNAYFVNIFLVSCFLVLILVAVINLIICGIVIRKRKVMPTGNEEELKRQKSQYKLTKMLLTVVGIFYVCWLPYSVTNTLLMLCPSECFPSGITQWLIIFVEFCKIPIGYNSAINPIIYVLKSKAFKRSFQKLLRVYVTADSTD